MKLEAIFVFPGGVVAYEKDGKIFHRSATLDVNDAFGTLGGRDRVEAAACVARDYPDAYLITTSGVYAEELRDLGVASARIIEETSINTGTAMRQVIPFAQKRGWKHIIFLSSGYHLPRIMAFYEQTKSEIIVHAISSESVLARHDPVFTEYFENIKKTSAYQKRLAAEDRGIQAIKNGSYQSASLEDKKERLV